MRIGLISLAADNWGKDPTAGFGLQRLRPVAGDGPRLMWSAR